MKHACDGNGKILLRVRAPNDVNGNPRRGWIVYDASGTQVDFVDEGYHGRRALTQAGYCHAVQLSEEFTINARTYRALVSHLSQKKGA